MEKLESDFKTFVDGLQKQYSEASDKKDADVEAMAHHSHRNASHVTPISSTVACADPARPLRALAWAC